jgi:glutamyl-tRNA reductase
MTLDRHCLSIFAVSFAHYMIRNYKIITLTHQNIDISEISHFVLKLEDEAEKVATLNHIKEALAISELVYLNTCNRVAFVIYNKESIDFEFITSLFTLINPKITKGQIDSLENSVSVYEGAEAINHVYEVSSSIDSLVVGEREIYRQMRDAFEWSKGHNLSGENMKLLESHLISTAKHVYNNTRIGEKPLSVVFLGYEFMISEGIDPNANILMVGAGETNQLMLKFLQKGGFKNIKIFNRTLANAERVAKLYDCKSHSLDSLNSHYDSCDVVISATNFPGLLVNQSDLTSLGKKRVFVDFSVPSNIDKKIGEEENCVLIDIDKLRLLAERNLNFRRKEVTIAKQIISNKVVEFQGLFIERIIAKSLSGIASEIKEVKHKAINQVFSKELASVDDDTKILISKMMDYMEKKCISIPMKTTKKAVLNSN